MVLDKPGERSIVPAQVEADRGMIRDSGHGAEERPVEPAPVSPDQPSIPGSGAGNDPSWPHEGGAPADATATWDVAHDPQASSPDESAGELRDLLRGLVLDEDVDSIEGLRAEIAQLRRAVEDPSRIERIVRACVEETIKPLAHGLEAERARLLAITGALPRPPSPAELRQEIAIRVAQEWQPVRQALEEDLPALVSRILLDQQTEGGGLLVRALARTLQWCHEHPDTRESQTLRETLGALGSPPGQARDPAPEVEASDAPTSPHTPPPTARDAPPAGSDRENEAPPSAEGTAAHPHPIDRGSRPEPPVPPRAGGTVSATPRTGRRLLGLLLARILRKREADPRATVTDPRVDHHRLPARVLYAALLDTDTGRLLVEATAPGEQPPDPATTQARLEAVRREILEVLVVQSTCRACEVRLADETIRVAMRDRLYLMVVMIGKPPSRFDAGQQRLLDRVYRRAARQWEPIDQNPSMRDSIEHSLRRFMVRDAAPRRRLWPW